jgi:hypothetical protein
MKYLSFREIVKCFEDGIKIDWHPRYIRQEWVDKEGPLTVTEVSTLDKKTAYVGYRCSDSSCVKCNSPLILVGHHKLIKPNGQDLYGSVKEDRKGNVQVTPLPVFTQFSYKK